jgi:hypothetical protein
VIIIRLTVFKTENIDHFRCIVKTCNYSNNIVFGYDDNISIATI